MRTTPFFFLLAVACSPAPADQRGDPIACALDGAASFEEVCRVMRDGEALVVFRPDGGFRRLQYDRETLTAFDGAEEAMVADIGDGQIEVAIGRDRYRLGGGDVR